MVSSIYGNFFSEFGCYQVVTELPFMEEWLKLVNGSDGLKRTKGQIFSLTFILVIWYPWYMHGFLMLKFKKRLHNEVL